MGTGTDPKAFALPQSTAGKCHAPHRTPTMTPVTEALQCRRIVGLANPVHPISSKKPAPTPIIRPSSVNEARLLLVVGPMPAVRPPKRAGVNSGENRDRTPTVTSETSGAVRSATAYHLAPTRHLNSR